MNKNILSRVGGYEWRMTNDGFWIGWLDLLALRLQSLLITISAIADLHNLQFTVTHALGFSVLPSRLMIKELKQSHCN
jgi:hypothetical protein